MTPLLPLLDAWWEGLLRATLHGAMLGGLIWVVLVCVPRIPPTAANWLWRMVFARFLCAAVLAIPVALPWWPQQLASPLPPLESLAGSPTTSPGSAAVIPGEVEVPPSGFDGRWIVLGIWLVGLLGCAALQWREARRAAALTRAGEPAAEELQELMAALAFEFGLRRTPKLLLTEGSGSPMLLATPGPVLLLPAGLMQRHTEAEIELMLAHELAHLKRRDLEWSWLGWICHAVFWFHPIVWLAGREARLWQEIACDELARRVTGAEPATYGEVLVSVAARSRLNVAEGLAAVGLEETPDTLKRRLRALQTRLLRGRGERAWGWCLLLLMPLLVAPIRLTASPGSSLVTLRPGPPLAYELTVQAGGGPGPTMVRGLLQVQLSQAEEAIQARLFTVALGQPQEARLWMTPTGEVLRIEGGISLPHAMGELAGSLLAPPPPAGRRVTRRAERSVSLPDNSARWPFGADQRLPAREVVVHTLSGNPAAPRHELEYHLQTVAEEAGRPLLELRGRGSRILHAEDGLPVLQEFSGTVTRYAQGQWVTLPISWRCRRQGALSPTEPAASSPTPGSPAKPETTSPIAPSPVALPRAASRLDEVSVAELLRTLTSGKDWDRVNAARRLGEKGDRSAVPALLRCLKSENFSLRWAALSSLGQLQDSRAASPIASMIERNVDRALAAQALKAMGPAAEPAALALLKHPDGWVRLEGVRVLESVGSRRSREPLQRAEKDDFRLTGMAATRALQALDARLKQAP